MNPATTETYSSSSTLASAELWAGSSAPDTDFVVRLVDLQPGGYMHNLCDGIVRARYRDSQMEPQWLETGQIYQFAIDLWSTAYTFKLGYRIGVQVTSSNFPRYDRNLNATEAPGAPFEVKRQTRRFGWAPAVCPTCSYR